MILPQVKEAVAGLYALLGSHEAGWTGNGNSSARSGRGMAASINTRASSLGAALMHNLDKNRAAATSAAACSVAGVSKVLPSLPAVLHPGRSSGSDGANARKSSQNAFASRTPSLPSPLYGATRTTTRDSGSHSPTDLQLPVSSAGGAGSVRGSASELLSGAESVDGRGSLRDGSEANDEDQDELPPLVHMGKPPVEFSRSPLQASMTGLPTPEAESASAAAAATSRHMAAETMRTTPRYGWLLKRGEVNKSSRRRYFALEGSSLAWYPDVPTHDATKPHGAVSLIGATAETASGSRFAFTVTLAASATVRRGIAAKDHLAQACSTVLSGKQACSTVLSGKQPSSRVLNLEAESEADRVGWLDAICAHAE